MLATKLNISLIIFDVVRILTSKISVANHFTLHLRVMKKIPLESNLGTAN